MKIPPPSYLLPPGEEDILSVRPIPPVWRARIEERGFSNQRSLSLDGRGQGEGGKEPDIERS
jgi:hypothetical protein